MISDAIRNVAVPQECSEALKARLLRGGYEAEAAFCLLEKVETAEWAKPRQCWDVFSRSLLPRLVDPILREFLQNVGPAEPNSLSDFKVGYPSFAHPFIEGARRDFKAPSGFRFFEDFVCARGGGQTQRVNWCEVHDTAKIRTCFLRLFRVRPKPCRHPLLATCCPPERIPNTEVFA